ncbi:MAG: zinc ribbon domain-containing protein [Anaerolineaceae bacterium]|jgi:NADH pyrophosphatase NudC (nudix superfamily)
MDYGSIFLILSLAALAALFVSRPFLTPRPAATLQAQRQARAEDHQRSALLAERDRLLVSLYDLDFDQALGKIPTEDYPAQRALLLQSGADVYRQLEALGYKEDIPSNNGPAGGAARKNFGRPLMAQPNDELEEIIAAYRKERQEKSAGFCPSCGKPVRKSDKFCARCGTSI